MAQAKPSRSERLQALIGDLKTPLWDDRLNQAFWAHDRRVEYPLTHYDEETWEGCLREGDPTARAVTQPEAILRHIEEKWPGSRLQINAQNGRAHVTLLITGLGRGVEGEFKGEVPLTDLGRALAIAFLRADDMAVSLQQRLLAVSDLVGKVPPYQDWPVHEVTPGRWGAVDHQRRLLCATANSAEGAARHAGMNHKGEYGLMLCRERYETLFAEADRVSYNGRLWTPDPLTAGGEPIAEAPRTPDPEDRFVWMVGTRASVLQDAYTAGPDNAPDILKLGMMEGEILIGKDRRGEVRVVREMGPDGCVDVPGRLEALRSDDSPEP